MLCEHVTKIKWNKYSKKKKRIYIFIDKYTIIHLSVLFAYYIGNISDHSRKQITSCKRFIEILFYFLQ